jgi:hypothetical protein
LVNWFIEPFNPQLMTNFTDQCYRQTDRQTDTQTDRHRHTHTHTHTHTNVLNHVPVTVSNSGRSPFPGSANCPLASAIAIIDYLNVSRLVLLIASWHGPHRKQRSILLHPLIVVETYLFASYIYLFRGSCLATGVYVTICSYLVTRIQSKILI